MIKYLKDTGFRWPKKPPNASEVKFNNGYKQWRGLYRIQHLVSQVTSVSWDSDASTKPATAHTRDR
jgi:hypothetical protein